MAKDTFKAVGWSSGFFVGWILERRFVKFTTDIPMEQRVVRLVSGLFVYYVIYFIINPLITSVISGNAGVIITCFIQMFYVMFLFPWVFNKLTK